MRNGFLFLVSLITLVGSVVATLGTAQIRDFELRGYVDATHDQYLPFIVPRFGVNADLTQYSQSELINQLDLMSQSNVTWVRQFAYWDGIEQQPGDFAWSDWDQIVETVKDFPELELVVVFMNTPKWARSEPPGVEVTNSAPPRSTQLFANFVSKFAERYGEIVDYYQIWDEPNLDDAWGMLHPKPAEYMALLSEAYTAIHNVDGKASILSAGLAPTTEESGQNISDLRYLDALYDYGLKDYSDIVSGKGYGFSLSSLDRTVDEATLNFSRIISLREIMVEHGDTNKSLWMSNWGWNSLPNNWSGEPSIWGSVTSQEQIQYTLEGLDRAHREWPWIGGMILHQWQPDAEPNNPQWGFSLLDQQSNATPLLEAIRDYDFPSVAENGLYHPLTIHAKYSGVWEFSALGADIGWLETTDSQLSFQFRGTDIAMLLREGDYVAFLYPTIDRQPANATPHDTDGNGYVFLRSNSREPETNLVPVSRNLQNQAHEMQIIADKGWDQWAIGGFAVSSGNLEAGYTAQLSIGLIAILVSTLVAVCSALTISWKSLFPVTTRLSSVLSGVIHLILSSITSVALMIGMLLTWSSQRPNILIRDDINLLIAIVTSGIIYLSPSFLLTIGAALFLFVLIFYRLETGLILTIFWLPFFLFPVELYKFAFPMSEVTILLTTGAWALKCLISLGTQLQMQNSRYTIFSSNNFSNLEPMDVAIAGMVLCAFISLLWSVRVGEAVTELRTFIIEPFFFYVILRSLRPNKMLLLTLVDALIISATLVAIIGLFQYVRGEAIITAEEGARRLASVYGSPNNVGLYLGRAIPLSLAFVLIKIDHHRRLFGVVTLLVMSVALALTQSVGAILLGIPSAVTIMLITLYGRKSLIPIATVGSFGLVGFAILTQISARFANILDFTSGTNFFRLRVWESAFEIIKNNPITGLGLDQFLYVFSGEYIRPDAIWDRDLSHPHNFLLDFWIRLGIAGVVIFVVIQGIFWRNIFQATRSHRNGDHYLFAVTVGVIGSMVDLLAHGLIDNSVFVNDLAFVFVLILAISITLKNIRFIDVQ